MTPASARLNYGANNRRKSIPRVARLGRAAGLRWASADLRSFTIGRALPSHERFEQAFTARGNLGDRDVEGLLVCLRRAVIPTDLSHKLKSGRIEFFGCCRAAWLSQDLNASAQGFLRFDTRTGFHPALRATLSRRERAGVSAFLSRSTFFSSLPGERAGIRKDSLSPRERVARSAGRGPSQRAD